MQQYTCYEISIMAVLDRAYPLGYSMGPTKKRIVSKPENLTVTCVALAAEARFLNQIAPRSVLQNANLSFVFYLVFFVGLYCPRVPNRSMFVKPE